MSRSNALQDWFKQRLQTSIAERTPLAGGDICQTERITTTDGRQLCVKQQPHAPPDFFAAEAEGLSALASSGCVRTPQVYSAEPGFIVMEYLAPAPPGPDYWAELGRGLAQMHRQPVAGFGFTRDNYCGATPQPNPDYEDGHAFFAEQRLRHQGRMALESGQLEPAEFERLDRLCQRLKSLIPAQHPALLHGDLWSGNIHSDSCGAPVLIDPACYWGWPEADMAMTCLFGGFSERFYRAYLEVNPLEPDWRERVPLYNLYHLINHLNLFGSSYHPQVNQVLERYT